MEIRILIAFIAVNLSVIIIRSAALGEEASSQIPEVTPTSEVTEQPRILGIEALANTPVERSGHAHIHADPTFKGFWAKKFAWRPRWVKTWQEKKAYVAVWKRMWGPVEVKEWVPVPKPPPGWVRHDAGSYIVKKFPHH